MTRVITVPLDCRCWIAGSSRALAQEITPGAGRVEVSIIPAGGVFFTERPTRRNRASATTTWAEPSPSTSTATSAWKVR